jgi:DNA-binding Lrp family transcriptional regulator
LHWENKDLDLHSRISKRLGLSKSNSIQILNRLKEAGYLRSTDSTVSLIPTIKYVNSILSIVSEPKKFEEKIYKAFSNAYKKYEAKVWDHWEDYYYSDLENVETFMVLGTEYYDDSKYEQLAQLKQDEFDNLSFEEVCDILSHLELWDIDEHINNKYVSSIDGDLSVEFRIDDSYLKEIRKSNKYKNDMELAMDEKLIDEIFKDLNIDSYFELKDIESKWAEQAEGKVVSGNTKQVYDEDEAPF